MSTTTGARRHVKFRLTCDDNARLMERAGGRCEVCRRAVPLFHDHDHTLGRWAVRGLVCHPCNRKLANVDLCHREATPAERRYMADPFWRTLNRDAQSEDLHCRCTDFREGGIAVEQTEIERRLAEVEVLTDHQRNHLLGILVAEVTSDQFAQAMQASRAQPRGDALPGAYGYRSRETIYQWTRR